MKLIHTLFSKLLITLFLSMIMLVTSGCFHSEDSGTGLSSSTEVVQFTILGNDATIEGNDITITVPYGSDVSSLTPTITLSAVDIDTAFGLNDEDFEEYTYTATAEDFSEPVDYTITAEDGSTEIYTVTVLVAANPAKDITQFTILGVDGSIGASTIVLTVPSGSDLTTLMPLITITGASVSPASDEVTDFTSAVDYTVTAEDGSTQVYSVTVSEAASTAKDISQFTILGVNGTVAADTIALTVPHGSVLSSLTPTITITGASVDPVSDVVNDFTSPVEYTVTAADASSKVYTVTVTEALSSAKDITQFTMLGIDGTIGTNTISLAVPTRTNLTSLTPTITITGASVSPLSGVANDFTNPVDYTVTAADGTSKVYTVTAAEAASSDKDITQFTILGVDGAISTNTITLTVPFGTDPSNLTPTITMTGASVSPLSGVANNFSSSVVYQVTAADASTQDYTVLVSVAANPAKNITQFDVGSDVGVIDHVLETIDITIDTCFGLGSVTPTISITGVSVLPASLATVDLSSPLSYTVTAADNSTKTYTVTAIPFCPG